MHSLQTILALLNQHLPELKQKYPILRVGIFGSYARGEETEESDIDIVVEMTEPMGLDFVAMADEIEGLFGIKTDVVSRNAIKPKYWATIEKEVIFL